MALVSLLVCSCSAIQEDPQVNAKAVKPPADPPAPHGIAPLTGRPAASPDDAVRPILAVALRTGAKTTGLDSADFVYEEIGSQRLVALFQSKAPDRVGPVAQARPFDAKILPVTRAIVATAGGPDKFLGQIDRTKGMTHLTTSDYKPGYRGGFAIPRNLYRKKPADEQPPPQLLQYAKTGRPPGSPATKLTIDLPGQDEVWSYDAAGKLWRRAGNPTFAAANVVVQVTPFKTVPLEQAGSSLRTTKPYGKGSATLVSAGSRSGELTLGSWRKAGTYELTLYSTGRSQPMLFAPGPTWAIIAPVGTKVKAE
jgi:Protein of unknown function (DUF3048) N-terminal domain/Protein of unknown function (DUF3048) C-terminal domain